MCADPSKPPCSYACCATHGGSPTSVHNRTHGDTQCASPDYSPTTSEEDEWEYLALEGDMVLIHEGALPHTNGLVAGDVEEWHSAVVTEAIAWDRQVINKRLECQRAIQHRAARQQKLHRCRKEANSERQMSHALPDTAAEASGDDSRGNGRRRRRHLRGKRGGRWDVCTHIRQAMGTGCAADGRQSPRSPR